MSGTTEHPMQPVELVKGIARFKQNAIVRALLTRCQESGYGLNEIWRDQQLGHYPEEDIVQLGQLIGYSVSAWGYLDSSPDHIVEAADTAVEALLAS